MELAEGEPIAKARTAAINVFAIGQAFYLLNCRLLTHSCSGSASFPTHDLGGYHMMLLGQAAITYLPSMNRPLSHHAVGPAEWVACRPQRVCSFTPPWLGKRVTAVFSETPKPRAPPDRSRGGLLAIPVRIRRNQAGLTNESGLTSFPYILMPCRQEFGRTHMRFSHHSFVQIDTDLLSCSAAGRGLCAAPAMASECAEQRKMRASGFPPPIPILAKHRIMAVITDGSSASTLADGQEQNARSRPGDAAAPWSLAANRLPGLRRHATGNPPGGETIGCREVAAGRAGATQRGTAMVRGPSPWKPSTPPGSKNCSMRRTART